MLSLLPAQVERGLFCPAACDSGHSALSLDLLRRGKLSVELTAWANLEGPEAGGVGNSELVITGEVCSERRALER